VRALVNASGSNGSSSQKMPICSSSRATSIATFASLP